MQYAEMLTCYAFFHACYNATYQLWRKEHLLYFMFLIDYQLSLFKWNDDGKYGNTLCKNYQIKSTLYFQMDDQKVFHVVYVCVSAFGSKSSK